jgi:uncharacterized protein with HEPN domain
MNRDIVKCLTDIQLSISSINEYLGEKKDFTDYQKNKMLRRAVEREFEIIGEAIARILKIDITFKIEEARRIVNTRNWVIHGYDKVDDEIMWGIISNDLPKLQRQVNELLESK